MQVSNLVDQLPSSAGTSGAEMCTYRTIRAEIAGSAKGLLAAIQAALADVPAQLTAR
jgi:hypothetical protein